jgi:Leucine-rich repeat (LRR) protein
MKKIYFLVMTLWVFTAINAQIITIPDANFKAKLIAELPLAYDANGQNIKIDLNSNGEIEVSEALKVAVLTIHFSEISNLTGIEYFTNLTSLTCYGNNLINLDVSVLSKLKYLSCFGNKLTSLNIKGLNNLEEVICHNNNLASIDLAGLSSLKKIDCEINQLTALDLRNLNSIEYVNCQKNKLSTINVNGLSTLLKLYCATNQLTNINVTDLTNLADFDFSNNQLSTFDASGLKSLQHFYCYKNQLTTLNVSGLSKLIEFYCNDNLLTSLNIDAFDNINNIRCNNNRLTSLLLNGSSNYYSSIDCDNNQLTTIDISNLKYLTSLSCNNNLLNYLILKSNAALNISISNNPNLQYICANEGQFTYFQSVLDMNGYLNCHMNPYCSFNPGGSFYTIKGNNKFDADGNGCDVSDINYPNLNYTISDGNQNGNLISNESGSYSIPVQEGTYTITPILENPTYFTISPSSVNVTFPTQASPFIQDFCITPKGNHQDLEVTILPTIPARPGFDAAYKIVYKNKGNSILSGLVSLTFNDAVLDYVSAIPAVNNQIIDKLNWDYTNLQPFETREITVTLNVNSPMETPAVNIGDRLSFNALINPVTGDEKPVDNSSALRQSVVGSFDPNDKTCLEGDIITPNLIGEYVNYLIRFENTGTYPAENIVVKDMIDLSKFDISTLVTTKASHEFVTKISDGNKVEFIFEKINLPFDDATNDGYIAFKIKTLPTLVLGDSFANEANIYFDYNFPILTNKATSTFKTLGTQDFEFADYFNVYPNPAKDILSIGMKNNIEVKSMSVYDILGQLVIAVPNAKTVSKIDVSKLTTGNYFLKMNTDKGTSSVKFIKQ